MIFLLFAVLMIVVFVKILVFAVKAAWGISKIIVTVVLLPLILLGLVLKGLIELAFPILLIIGVVSFLVLRD